MSLALDGRKCSYDRGSKNDEAAALVAKRPRSRESAFLRQPGREGTCGGHAQTMGETTGITRTLARLTPGKERDPRSYTLGYRYDYQGRMETITYPDGERLTYHYDHGGQVNRVTGTWNGTEYVYVEAIGYDEFGQRNHIRYGNGVETTYQYDQNRRWLAHITTTSGTTTLQSIDYRFDRVGNILSTINTGTTRQSSQSYTYDDRYQLVGAVGTTTTTLGGLTLEENHYTQRYRYDVIGNMTAKTSTNRIMPSVETPAHLNYDLTYTYDPARPHQATRIGELAYRYDPNGNLTQVYDPTTTGPATPPAPPREDLGPYRGSAPEAFGRYRWNESAEPEEPIAGYRWNEDNRLTQSTTGDNVVTDYRYDAQGTRRVKYSRMYGETLYADRMYQEHVGTTATAAVTKHIFVGQTRIASKLHYTDQTPSTRALYMQQNTFYYHPDHLGSTNWVTDAQGEGYEHFTYTPYGEAWVEEHLSSRIHRMTHRFTGQELDPETGLYAFPARNYDPRTSRWLSADPALEEYLPIAPTSDEAREHNQNLPGGGGVFVHVNLAVYHYSANNPLRYVDPTGLSNEEADLIQQAVAYLVEQANAYADSLREEASASGRASLSLDLSTTIGGVKVKGSVTGVAEYNAREDKTKLSLVIGLDIGAGTPGQERTNTGASLTVGLRATFGNYKNRESSDGSAVGLLDIAVAANGSVEVLGRSVGVEYRRQIINFDTQSGWADFSFFDPNTNKIGIRTQHQGIRGTSMSFGGRFNGF